MFTSDPCNSELSVRSRRSWAGRLVLCLLPAWDCEWSPPRSPLLSSAVGADRALTRTLPSLQVMPLRAALLSQTNGMHLSDQGLMKLQSQASSLFLVMSSFLLLYQKQGAFIYHSQCFLSLNKLQCYKPGSKIIILKSLCIGNYCELFGN